MGPGPLSVSYELHEQSPIRYAKIDFLYPCPTLVLSGVSQTLAPQFPEADPEGLVWRHSGTRLAQRYIAGPNSPYRPAAAAP